MRSHSRARARKRPFFSLRAFSRSYFLPGGSATAFFSALKRFACRARKRNSIIITVRSATCGTFASPYVGRRYPFVKSALSPYFTDSLYELSRTTVENIAIHARNLRHGIFGADIFLLLDGWRLHSRHCVSAVLLLMPSGITGLRLIEKPAWTRLA